jgi:hypothetical protein
MAGREESWTFGGVAAGSALALTAALALPWATYEVASTGTTTAFKGGSWSVGLIAFTAATFIVRLFYPLGILAIGQLVAAVGSLVAAICLALTQIANANAAMAAAGGTTSYALGSGVGVIAAALLVVSSAVSLGQSKSGAPTSTRPVSQSSA